MEDIILTKLLENPVEWRYWATRIVTFAFMCPHCKVYLCDSWFKQKIQRKTQGCPNWKKTISKAKIVLSTFVEDIESSMSSIISKSSNICSVHNKEFEFYCKDCEILLWSKWAVLDKTHRDHQMDDFEESWQRNKNSIQQSALELQTTSRQWKEKYMSMLQTKNTFWNFIELERKQLIDFANRLIKWFDKDAEMKKGFLDREQNRFKDIIYKLEVAQKNVALSINSWNPISWIKDFSKLQEYFDEAKDIDIPEEMSKIDYTNLPSNILPRFDTTVIVVKGINERATVGQIKTESVIIDGIEATIITDITYDKDLKENNFSFYLYLKNVYRIPIWNDFKVVLNKEKDGKGRIILDTIYNDSLWRYLLSINGQSIYSLKNISCFIHKSKIKFNLYVRQKGFYERFLDQIKYINLLEGDQSIINDYRSIQDNFKLANETFQNVILENNKEREEQEKRDEDLLYGVNNFSWIDVMKGNHWNLSEAIISPDKKEDLISEIEWLSEEWDNNENTDDTMPKKNVITSCDKSPIPPEFMNLKILKKVNSPIDKTSELQSLNSIGNDLNKQYTLAITKPSKRHNLP